MSYEWKLYNLWFFTLLAFASGPLRGNERKLALHTLMNEWIMISWSIIYEWIELSAVDVFSFLSYDCNYERKECDEERIEGSSSICESVEK